MPFSTSSILWTPSANRVSQANLTRFMARFGFGTIEDLYQFSIAQVESFWSKVYEFVTIESSLKGAHVFTPNADPLKALWFADTSLNFAQNLLRFNDEKIALIFWGEDQVRSTISYRELRCQVSSVAAAFKSYGVTVGDRVAGFMPNMPETVIAMLAATSLGAIWTSCSPDFGIDGVSDRFGQTKPKILIAADGYYFKGLKVNVENKIQEIAKKIPSIEKIILVHYAGNKSLKDNNIISWETILEKSATLEFAQLPWNHPLYVMYSSGTTGKPKCIVHGAGGTLLEHLKELVLHVDLKREDIIFYQTTCGWMMWNWLVSSLAVGATIVLYDGSPILAEGKILFDLAEKENVTVFGTNAKFLMTAEKAGLSPKKSHRLKMLKTILSTGSPLVASSFDYVYREIGEDILLSSISGGTDILGCFALGCPLLPVRSGELQMRSLGLAVDVFDQKGNSIIGEKGELVCKAPFPSMPVSFWDDPKQEKYRAAYFSRFPGIWHHGDYVELTSNGGMIFYGRSDAVLNPGGVRIGTAEIYRLVEGFQEIEESIAIGQNWQDDVRVVLFVKMRPDCNLDDTLKERLTKKIRQEASPFHVPKIILAVKDIPRTKSGKIVELAVRDIVHGNEIQNIEALSNPESLEYFRNRVELS